jgi:hypothetical protein
MKPCGFDAVNRRIAVANSAWGWREIDLRFVEVDMVLTGEEL